MLRSAPSNGVGEELAFRAINMSLLRSENVRLIGFIAQKETPPIGAFYLCPRPVTCDEEGGGTADSPHDSVFINEKPKQVILNAYLNKK